MLKQMLSIIVSAVVLSSIRSNYVSSTFTSQKPPFIKIANSEIIIEVNTNKTIECEAKEPITWISEVCFY